MTSKSNADAHVRKRFRSGFQKASNPLSITAVTIKASARGIGANTNAMQPKTKIQVAGLAIKSWTLVTQLA